MTMEQQSRKYKEIIIFLFNQFLKSKNPDDVAEEEISDDEYLPDVE